MARIVVSNIDDDVVSRLKQRAKGEGRSLQAEVKVILEEAANLPGQDMKAARELSLRIRRSLKNRRFDDSAELIREDR
jgi:plasmid stability protein